ALRGTAGEDRRETPDHVPRLVFLRASLALARRELVQRPAGGRELGAELLGGALTGRSSVREAAELRGLDLQPALDAQTRTIFGDVGGAAEPERDGHADHHADAQGSDRQGGHLGLLS